MKNWSNEISADVGRRHPAALTYDQKLRSGSRCRRKIGRGDLLFACLMFMSCQYFLSCKKLTNPPL
jgi:hypothetical protein